jgi:hypothetical protein
MGQPPDRGQDELPLLLAPHQGHGQERHHLHGRGRLRRKISSHLPPAEEKTSKDQKIKQIRDKYYQFNRYY